MNMLRCRIFSGCSNIEDDRGWCSVRSFIRERSFWVNERRSSGFSQREWYSITTFHFIVGKRGSGNI